MPATSKTSGSGTFASLPALVGVKNMITFSGTRTVLAGLGLALAGSVALAPPASAVSQASAESAFRSAGITWTSSGGCTNPGNSTCTSFEGLRQASVDGAVTLKGASGCALTI